MKAIHESQLWKKRLGDWGLNPYVGCEHGCKHCYCPAMPGVKFHNDGHTQAEWGSYLKPKEGLVEALRQQLKTFTPDKAKRTDWGDGWILVSFLTDCYTPAEAEHRLTRQCLQLLLEAGHKVRLQTRSALVERDFDLLTAHRDRVLLGTSLPYLDDQLARILEPRATGPTRRLKMLQKATEAGLSTYVAVAPFMPWSEFGELCAIFNAIAGIYPREIFCEVLNPKGTNLTLMSQALMESTPFCALEYASLRAYDEKRWAEFTFEILDAGQGLPNFIGWPDTGRAWRKHLSQDQRLFLETMLPQPAGSLS